MQLVHSYHPSKSLFQNLSLHYNVGRNQAPKSKPKMASLGADKRTHKSNSISVHITMLPSSIKKQSRASAYCTQNIPNKTLSYKWAIFNQYPTAKTMKQVKKKGKRVKIPVDLSTKKSESLGAEEREPPERASLVDFS
jgi:hypothetical protein